MRFEDHFKSNVSNETKVQIRRSLSQDKIMTEAVDEDKNNESHLQEEEVTKIPQTHSEYSENPQRDRVLRERSMLKPSQCYEANMIEFEEPTTYEEARCYLVKMLKIGRMRLKRSSGHMKPTELEFFKIHSRIKQQI